MPAAEKWLEEKWPEIREEYDPEDIWNGDETGLFYRALPNKTLAPGDKPASGGKVQKERVTAFVVCNSVGEKKKLLIIGTVI